MATKKPVKKTAAEKKGAFDALLKTAFNTPVKKKASPKSKK